MPKFKPPRWLRELIDSEAGDSIGIRWYEPDEWADLEMLRPSEMYPRKRRLMDDQRDAQDDGFDDMVKVGVGPPVYPVGKHKFRMELWVNAEQPDTLWVAFIGQPTFLLFSAGRDEDSLIAAFQPYLPTDLAHPREHRSTEELQADLAEAAKGPIPGPAPGQTHSVRLQVGLALATVNNETPLDFDKSLLDTGIVDPRFLMQGSISQNFSPAVTVVRTLYSRSTVRLDWYENLDGMVFAEIYYAPATQHETIQALNERFRLNYPLDIPVDVPALLLGLEAITAPAMLEHITRRMPDPDVLVTYLNCLVILTQPDVAEYLRPFMNHPAAAVRKTVIHYAAQLAPALLWEMQRTEPDPDLQAQIAGALGSVAVEAEEVSVYAEEVQEEDANATRSALKEALAKAFNRSPTTPASDAFVLLNPNPRANQAAVIADIAATFPSAPPVTVSQPPEAWGPYFHFGNVTVRTYILPMPMPADHLEASYGSSWLWPTAKDDLQSHNAMLILSADGGDTAADRMTPLTMLAAAFVGTCPQAIGVFWDGASHLIKGQTFRELAVQQLPAQLPLSLWLGCPVWQNPDGTTSGHTVGLAHFDLPELEAADAPLDVTALRQRLLKLAGRLITQRPNIRDGAVIGRSATETLSVSYGASRFGLGERVMRLHHQKVG